MYTTFERIAQFLHAPVFADEEQTRIAQTLHVICAIVSIGLIIETLLSLTSDNPFATSLILGELLLL